MSCVDQSLKSGLLLAASQGGYVNVPREIALNPRLYVSVHPDAPIKTPLWLNEGQSYIPTYELIEEQLAQHIDGTITSCLQNLSSLNEISTLQELSVPKVSVKINERDVTAYLNYSISYTQGTLSQKVDKFTYVLSVPLKEMMESAKIVAKEVTDSEFFELATIDLISSADPTIPVANMQLSCSTPKWQVSDVKNNISQLLYQMIPRVRVAGAESTPFDSTPAVYENLQKIQPDDFSEPATSKAPIKEKVPRGYANAPQDAYEYNHLYIDSSISNQLKANGVTVSFDYEPMYGLDMAVRPSDGITMTGSSGTGENKYLKFICLQVYHFTYDLLFPIQATIVKENAFKDGTPLAFRFALPVQIQRNLPNKDGFSLTNIEANIPGGRLCEDKVPYQTTVRAVNRFTGEFIKGANVEFHCYKYSCDLGTTRIGEGSFNPQLSASIPSFCSGGSVYVTHPNYVPAEEYFYSAPDLLSLEMFPLQNVSFSVLFGPNPRAEGYSRVVPAELNVNQEAVVHIESNQVDYDTYASYRVPKPGEPNVVQLIGAAGTYNITVLVYETTDGKDASLVGAYYGGLRVLNSNLDNRNQLVIYAKDFNRLVPQDQVAGTLAGIQNDSIVISSHAPGWIS